MYAYSKISPNYLHLHVLLALALIGVANTSSAAPCTDNFDGTYSCPTDSENIDTTLTGTLILDNASGNATLNNTTTEAAFAITGAPASITNSVSTLGTASVITLTGNNAVTINNTGGFMNLDRSAAPFNPAGWSTDANGLLYNDFDGLGPVLAGYAAVISAGPNVSALTINNISIALPGGASFIPGTIGSSGDFDPNHFTAAVFTNSPLLTINNGGTIGNILSFGTGNTVINDNGGNPYGAIYAVDRNPLLVAAQEAYLAANGNNLTLAYSTADVGIRNSTINFNKTTLSGNVFLGSGKHEINNVGGVLSGNITVDQRDLAVVDVLAGVATPQAPIHGDRTFTFNSSQVLNGPSGLTGSFTGNLNIIAVPESVNTITIASNDFNSANFIANSIGVNTLNLNCTTELTPTSQAGCGIGGTGAGNVTGFSSYNLFGSKFVLSNSVNVTDVINLNAGIIELSTTASSPLTAPRVVVGNNTLLQMSPASGADAFNTAYIVGNLENNGTINLNNNTLDVNGDVNMNAGAKLKLNITPASNGKINNSGTATFLPNSTLIPEVNISQFGVNTNVRNGEVRTIANNVSGLPTVQNANSLLQWVASENAGNLIITANIGVPNFLAPQLSPAAKNAINAVFAYTGSDAVFTGLQAQLIAQRDENLISAAERLHPESSDGAFRMVQGNADKFFGILESRLTANYLKATPDPMQVAATAPVSQLGSANPVMSKGVWVQGFGDRGSQDGMNGFDGYASSSAGFAAGVDKAIDAVGNQRVGFAAAYTRGNVTNSGNTVNNRADINSFMAAAYGSWAMDDWYLNGMLGFGRNTYQTYRRLIEHASSGNHDSWQFSSRVDAGMPILFSDNLTFTPLATLDYTHLNESGYTENGDTTVKVFDSTGFNQVIVNGLPQFKQASAPTNLVVESRDFDSIRGGVGAKAIYRLQEKDWAAELELHGLFRHEFGDLAQDSRARFVVGGNSFASPGIQPERNSLLLGGSVSLTGDDEDDQLTLLTSYDAELREKYLGQIVTLNVRYDFDQAPQYIKGAKAKLATKAAKQVREQKVDATQKDIANINQAMQAEPEFNSESNALDANQQAIDSTIKTWLTAQSNKNMEVYFNSYAADFSTPDGSNRHLWERNRRNELDKEDNQAIKISYLSIKPQGNRALAMFTQTKATADKQIAVRKLIDLENRNGRWLIVREDSMVIE